MVIVGERTAVRPATEADVELLVAWHADPEISRYWDGETFTAAEMHERLARERVDAWIIEEARDPIGYVQSWWDEGEPRRGGIDGFLVPGARGRGLMPDAARALAGSLIADGWTRVTVDPYAWNGRAIRGWQKAGFVEVEDHDADEEHVTPWLLMEFRG